MFSILERIWRLVTGILAIVSTLGPRLDRIEGRLTALETGLAQLQEKIDRIIGILEPGPAVKIVFNALFDDGGFLEDITNMDLKDSQRVTLSIAPKDKRGNPAPVDGVPEWNSSNTEVLTVEAAADGLSAVVTPVGPLGTATVSVTADADLGTGVTEIAGTLDVNVIASTAATVAITAGTPVDIP